MRPSLWTVSRSAGTERGDREPFGMAFAPTAASMPCCSSRQAAKAPPLTALRSTLVGNRVSLPRPSNSRSNARVAPQAVAATKPAVTEKKSGAKPAEMSSEIAADLYRDMKLGRDFEDMSAQMNYRGKMLGE